MATKVFKKWWLHEAGHTPTRLHIPVTLMTNCWDVATKLPDCHTLHCHTASSISSTVLLLVNWWNTPERDCPKSAMLPSLSLRNSIRACPTTAQVTFKLSSRMTLMIFPLLPAVLLVVISNCTLEGVAAIDGKINISFHTRALVNNVLYHTWQVICPHTSPFCRPATSVAFKSPQNTITLQKDN